MRQFGYRVQLRLGGCNLGRFACAVKVRLVKGCGGLAYVDDGPCGLSAVVQ